MPTFTIDFSEEDKKVLMKALGTTPEELDRAVMLIVHLLMRALEDSKKQGGIKVDEYMTIIHGEKLTPLLALYTSFKFAETLINSENF